MAKNSKDVYGARGKTNVLMFDPEDLVLVEEPGHPLYDDRVKLPVSESLVRNIMYHGVLETIVVRKNPETGKTEVVAGRQRVKAVREANRRLREQGAEPIMVPATVRRGDDGSLAGVMVSENEQREDDTPLGRAKKMSNLLALGKTEEDLCILFGCTKTTVKNSLALLECCAAVKSAVEAGKITVTSAYELSKLEPEAQRTTVEKMIAESEGEKGHKRSRKQREAAGKRVRPTAKQIENYRAEIKDNCSDPAFRTVALAMLGWALGGPQPRFPKAKADSKTEAA